MKRALCVFLTLILIFVFGSCNTSVDSVFLEQNDTNTSIMTEVTAPETEGIITTLPITTPESEVTTPEPETTTPESEITTSEPEATTPAPDDGDFPEMPEEGSEIDFMIAKLSMFESVFQEDSRGWCIYDDIMGSSVTEVLSKKDLLIAAGCNEVDIYLAGQATENLRVLLKAYNDLRTKEYSTDDDKYIELYRYYADNYDDLTQSFCDLYKTLKGLYGNKTVSNYIALKGKAEHYRQLVGHLYVVSTALDQGTYRNEVTWCIDRKTLREVIEDVHYFPDGDWYPPKIEFPQS